MERSDTHRYQDAKPAWVSLCSTHPTCSEAVIVDKGCRPIDATLGEVHRNTGQFESRTAHAVTRQDRVTSVDARSTHHHLSRLEFSVRLLRRRIERTIRTVMLSDPLARPLQPERLIAAHEVAIHEALFAGSFIRSKT